MSGDVQVRFCERLEVKLLKPTHPTKLRGELGWAPNREFESALAETVAWYRDNRAWWNRVLSGQYRSYYEQQYGRRLRA